MLRRGLEVGGLRRWVAPGGVRGLGYLLALGLEDQRDEHQGGESRQAGEYQQERRKTPGGGHRLPPNRGGGGHLCEVAAHGAQRRGDGPPDRMCRDRHITPFHYARSSHFIRIDRSSVRNHSYPTDDDTLPR